MRGPAFQVGDYVRVKGLNRVGQITDEGRLYDICQKFLVEFVDGDYVAWCAEYDLSHVGLLEALAEAAR